MEYKNYSGFAGYYDFFMRDLPYDKWNENITGILKKHGINDGLVCELACGTGEMTMRLRNSGYDMIGIDISEDMLGVAKDKMYDEMPDDEETDDFPPKSYILYLKQDMREFELFGTVRAIISVCDSMNYIVDPEDLAEIFRRANNYLDPQGLFIFDMKSVLLYETEYADNVFTEEDEESGETLSWRNHYDKDSRINVYEIRVEDPDVAENSALVSEKHVQRAYTPEEIKNIGEQAGMEFVCALNADTMEPAGEDTLRYYYVFREKKQENKFYL